MSFASYGKMFQGTLPQLFAALAATLFTICDGMQYGWSAPVIPFLMRPNSAITITEHQGELLEIFYWIGSLLCLPITMFLVDKIGRKYSILVASFAVLCVWVILGLAPSVEYLYVARIISGAASNTAYVSIPMYIAEIAEQKIRGFLGSLVFLMMLMGVLLIYTVAPFVPNYISCIIGGCIVCLELIIFPCMPESPYYLIIKDNVEGAKTALQRLRKSGADIEKEFIAIKAAITRQQKEQSRFIDLFLVPSHRRAIIILIVLNMAQHFSGISVLLMNLHKILDSAGIIYMKPSTAGILFAFILLLAATISTFLIDNFGRKALLITSSILSSCCILIIAVYFSLKNSGYDTSSVSWLPIVSVMLYACSFKLGLGLVPIVLAAELFPAKIKSYGMTLADGMYVIASLLSLQVYQRLKESYGLEYSFYVFAMCSLLTALFCYMFLPETKGKTLEEIQMTLTEMTQKDKTVKKTQTIDEMCCSHL